eukprot:gene6413-6644_t
MGRAARVTQGPEQLHQQLQAEAETVAAQRLRYLQALGADKLAGSAASLPAGDQPADHTGGEMASAAAADVDADAAREYQKFMAGAKVSTAKMWSSNALKDMPKFEADPWSSVLQESPQWWKAWYRLAAACTALQQHSQAVEALQLAAALSAPDDTCQDSSRTELLQQLQQGMAGYPWEPQDWEWRPTWTASMRRQRPIVTATPGDAGRVAMAGAAGLGRPQAGGSSTSLVATHGSLLDSYANDLRALNGWQHMQLLGQLTHSLAELEGPQRGMQLLQDEAMLQWYKSAIEAAAVAQGPGAVVLVLSHGSGGILGLLAAAAPEVAKVVVIEKGRWGYRAAAQLLEHSRSSRPAIVNKVQLVPAPLHRCQCGNRSSASKADASGNCGSDDGVTAPLASPDGTHGHGNLQSNWQYSIERAADILVTDLFDYSVLGQGLLPNIDAAAAAGLLLPDAVTVPDRISVCGQLVNTQLNQLVVGFDLREVNKYKWHPTLERITRSRFVRVIDFDCMPRSFVCSLI